MHILKMHIYACLVFHICAYFVHIHAYGNFAYMCIFCFCIFDHIMFIMHTFCIFLICLFVHIPAYLVLHIAAYFMHISAYLNLHIMAYLPSCIFKHVTHISAYKMHIYAYCLLCTYISYFSLAYAYLCIFLSFLVLRISCIFQHILICI